MRLILKCFFSILLSLFLIASWAKDSTSTWVKQTDKQFKIPVYLFLSSTCPYCHKADEFFKTLEASPWLEIHRYFINTDKSALATFNNFLVQQNSSNFSVPAFFFCNSHWISFADAQSTGKTLLRALTFCRNEVQKNGQLTETTTKVMRQWANANWYENSITEYPSAANFIVLMAISDSLNPCSLFCFLALFAFLWLVDNPRLKVVAGFCFILAVALMHALQQIPNALFIQWLSWMRLPAAFIGLALAAYALNYFRNLTRQRPHAFLMLVVLSALAIQAFMQICLPNFSLIFEQWRVNQPFSKAEVILLEIIYQLIYVMPLLIGMLIFGWLPRANRVKRHSKTLSKTAQLLLLLTALLLVIYPVWLSVFGISVLVLAVAILAAVIFRSKDPLFF
nr:hypothetical protein [Legionella jordanis]